MTDLEQTAALLRVDSEIPSAVWEGERCHIGWYSNRSRGAQAVKTAAPATASSTVTDIINRARRHGKPVWAVNASLLQRARIDIHYQEGA